MDENSKPQETQRESHSINTFFRFLFAKRGEKVSDVAAKLIPKRTASSLAGSLKHGRMNLGLVKELLDYCGEPLIIKLKNGDEIELIVNDKPTKNDTK